MILATHAVIGAALAGLTARPEQAFLLGVLSHFLLDMIPHWDYRLVSLVEKPNEPLKTEFKINRRSLADFGKVALDLVIGGVIILLLLYYADWPRPFLLWWGTLGGLLPDGLQFFYYRTHWPWLSPPQRFHHWMHSRSNLTLRPRLGISLQAVLAAALVWSSLWLR